MNDSYCIKPMEQFSMVAFHVGGERSGKKNPYKWTLLCMSSNYVKLEKPRKLACKEN